MAAILLSLWLAITPYAGCIDGSDCRTDDDCGSGFCQDAICVCLEDDHDGNARR